MSLLLSRRAFTTGLSAVPFVLSAPHLAKAQAKSIAVYSGRHYDTDEALYGDFTKLTGISITRVDADADPLLERLKSEGVNSPADILITVDAGRIERAREFGLLKAVVSEKLNAAIPAHLREPTGLWYGYSTRARVMMVTDKVKAGEIARYEDLADPKFKGRIAIRSSNSVYNQSMVGSILAANGSDKTLEWAKGLVANFARKPTGGDRDQVKAVVAGEGDIAICNTYYLVGMLRSKKAEEVEIAKKVKVIFPNQGDRGTHVNISAAGMAAHAKNPEGAKLFLEYLATPAAQTHFSSGNGEYPVVAGVEMAPELKALGSFKADSLNASVFARNNAEALKIMDQAGWK